MAIQLCGHAVANLPIALFYTDNSFFFLMHYGTLSLSALSFLQKTSYLHTKLVTNYLPKYISSVVSKNVSQLSHNVIDECYFLTLVCNHIPHSKLFVT